MTLRFQSNWALGALIPAFYVIVELAFNYQLTNTASETVSEETLVGLEFWGRLISGIGLGLLIYRLNLAKLTSKLLPLILCLIGGVIVMWNVQRELTDYLIETANPADKSAAVALAVLAKDAAAGNLTTLKGQPIVDRELTAFEKKSVMALFPAAALHSDDRVEQINSWIEKIPTNYEVDHSPEFTPEIAYKNLIVPPIALGLSILFAILNFSLLLSFLIERVYKKHQLLFRSLIFSALVVLSAYQTRGFTGSDGYRESLRTGLWQNKLILALLVEWSGSASLSWGEISEFASERLLFGYSFKKPSWSPL